VHDVDFVMAEENMTRPPGFVEYPARGLADRGVDGAARGWLNPADGVARWYERIGDGDVTSYPQLPVGGVKSSGHGRELSVHGIREFCNIKSVWIGFPGRG
jgi:hypothetical protein